MLKIENELAPSLEMLEAVIRGARNPMNSWEKSDSDFHSDMAKEMSVWSEYHLGYNDFNLLACLSKAGRSDRKYLRMIAVYTDIIAPLYWWKEFDTYKVGTVANSCSTMHKITAKEFTLDDFSHDHLTEFVPGGPLNGWTLEENDLISFDSDPDYGYSSVGILKCIIKALNFNRKKYLETKTKPMKEEAKRAPLMKTYWWQMIQLLPSSYNQKRTVMLNYEVLANIYKSRRNHKLDEWHTFCDWIEGLPYSELITGKEKTND